MPRNTRSKGKPSRQKIKGRKHLYHPHTTKGKGANPGWRGGGGGKGGEENTLMAKAVV